MIYAVLNLSGNTCKTTNTQNLLLPRIPNCDVLRVETFNSDGALSEGEVVSAKDWNSVQSMLFNNDNIILDIGASNISDFMDSIEHFEGSQDDIDYFIIPTVPEEKQITDTISTIDYLLNLGIDESKIRLIFNKVNSKSTSEEEFYLIKDSTKLLGLDFNSIPRIEHSQMFELLSKTKQTMQNCLLDETDFKGQLKETARIANQARKDGDSKLEAKERKKIAVLTIRQSTQRLVKRQASLYDDEFIKLDLLAD